MARKELIVVLILALLVILGATVRFLTAPIGATGPRPRPKPTRPAGSPGKGAAGGPERAPLWPPLNDRTTPTDPDALRLFEAGETLASESLFDAAIAAYTHFLESWPEGAPAEMALLRIAQCHTLAKRPKEAADGYELFLRRHPASPFRPLALLWGGESLLRIGQPELARLRLSEVVAKFPSSPFVDSAKALLSALDAAPPPPKAKAP